MAYQVRCVCSRKVDVEMWQAGTDVKCSCGQAVRVPSSVDLLGQRDEQGNLKGSLQRGIEYHVMDLVKSGQLPGDRCVNCNSSTDGRVKLLCECSKAVVKIEGPSTASTVLLTLLAFMSPLKFLLFFGAREREEIRTETGTDVLIDTPLAMCEYCREEFASWSTGRIKRYLELMRTIPEYDELLQKYPQAVLHE
ncbi:MAG: hypothetical protein R3C18_18820 [Planctomycetaceae bacterium]